MLVSIVLYCQNARDTVEAALESVLRQSLSSDAYEIILLDDASTDGTFELIGSYQRQREQIRYVRLPVAGGPAQSYDCALRSACGKYVTWLDAHDALHSNMLSSCLEPLEGNKADLAYCDYYEVSYSTSGHTLVQLEPFDPSAMITGATILRTSIARKASQPTERRGDFYARYLSESGTPPARIPLPLYYSCVSEAKFGSDGLVGLHKKVAVSR